MEEYVKIKDKALKISGYKEMDGKTVPVIKAKAEEIKHPDGHIDVVVKVPVLQIGTKQEEV
ncbi:MAG: hypothetical protein JRI45_10240 [Deltaproteobacteria bacterium]|nr:hypothetical protein [Deltaproteobacteria bacterium]